MTRLFPGQPPGVSPSSALSAFSWNHGIKLLFFLSVQEELRDPQDPQGEVQRPQRPLGALPG